MTGRACVRRDFLDGIGHRDKNHVTSGSVRSISCMTRLFHALLYRASEFEALLLRPGERNYLRRAFLRAKRVEFDEPIYVSHGFRFYKAAPIRIGARSCFGENTGVYAHAALTIGDDFLAAPGLTINSGTHDVATLVPGGTPITIGDRVWCGVNVTIVAGARIGDDCVIGANSLVLDEIPPRSLAFGSPAQVVRTDIRPLHSRPWSCYPTKRS